jgi:hypothetical protein
VVKVALIVSCANALENAHRAMDNIVARITNLGTKLKDIIRTP